MTHEFKNILNDFQEAQKKGMQTILATVVALDGSSYRKPGVRMLIREDQKMTGAVSGGCVEKEILQQSLEVFKTGIPKIMIYDGRYRLGCEGVLYILIEPFCPAKELVSAFNKTIQDRTSFVITSYFSKTEGSLEKAGSTIQFDGKEEMSFLQDETKNSKSDRRKLLSLSEKMKPCFKLVLIGSEHDAVQLCQYASLTGWEVTVVASISEAKHISNFPGAKELVYLSAEKLDGVSIDSQTAVLLMTHSYAKDLQYLVKLKGVQPAYIGILGPAKRREKLLHEVISYCPDVEEEWLEKIHGPAGINIGSITPQEIAISIMAEILSVVRREVPIPLKDKKGSIHESVKI
ncbi:MAG: XdhC family protein [Cellulophaga sp.]